MIINKTKVHRYGCIIIPLKIAMIVTSVNISIARTIDMTAKRVIRINANNIWITRFPITANNMPKRPNTMY